MTPRVALALLLAAAAPMPATAADTRGPAARGDTLLLSLDDVVNRAIEKAPDARIARARIGSAQGRVREAIADVLPQVSGSLDYTRTFGSIFQGASTDTIFGPILENSPFAAVNQWTGQLTASQLLYSRKVGSALSAARVYRAGTLADRREAEAEVALAARRAYWNAACARQVYEIAVENHTQLAAHERDAERLYRQGLRAEYDWIRAQVDTRNAGPTMLAARNEWESSLLDLKRLIDLPPGLPVALSTPLEFADGRVPVVASDTVSVPKRAALESAELNVKLHQKAITIESAERWPSLTASATVGQQAFPHDYFPARDQFLRDVHGSLKLEIPILQGGRVSGAVQRAKGDLQEAEANRDRIRQDALIEQEHARQEARRALASLAARRGTADLARRGYRIADVRYRDGLSTAVDLDAARLQLRISEVNEVQAVRDYLNALAWLEFAQGAAPTVRYVPLEDLPPDGMGDSER